jgi:hypothetical protein
MIWKTCRIAAVFAPLALGGCAGLAGGGQYVDLSSYDRGKLHYDAGHFGLAVKHFQSAVDRVPGSVEALNGLAASYDRLGRYDLAARYYGRALGADPDSIQTLNNIGYSYLLQKRFDLAVAYLRDAHSRDKKEPVVLANRKTAEAALQEADLKGSAEVARSKLAKAPPVRPAEVEEAKPAVRITVAAARLARRTAPPRGPVKPWIERTAPKIQTLVTQPQMALLGIAERAGISPQLAAYRPKQPKPADLLPDLLAAPLVLEDGPSTGLESMILPEVTAVELNPHDPIEDAPMTPEEPRTAPAAGLVPTEVTVASLDPLTGLGEDASLRSDAPVAPALAGLVPTEVTVASLDPVVPTRRIEDTMQPSPERGLLPLVEVSNGTGRLRMAARIRSQLEGDGIVVRRLTNADAYTHMESTIFYRAGWREYAEALARLLPAVIDVEGRDDQLSDIRLELGGDLLDFDRRLYYAVRRSSGAHSG